MKFIIDHTKGILGRHDPIELWKEITDYIPDSVLLKKDVKILSIACGHSTETDVIVKRMLALGRTIDEIKNSIYLVDKYGVFTKDAIRKGYKNVIKTDFLIWYTNMKFDVLLSNPPYQDPTNNKRFLWNQILDKAITLTKPNGYIVFITPATWLWTSTNLHNSYVLFEDLQVDTAVIYARDDTPFDEGTSVSWVIARNIPKENKSKLIYARYSDKTKQDIGYVDFKVEKKWPGDLTDINLSIHNKLRFMNTIRFEKINEFHNQKLKQKKLVSDTKTNKFKYTHHVSAKITRYTSIKFSRAEEWKVMVPSTSTIEKAVIDNNCGHGEDMFTLYVNDKEEAMKWKALFSTRMYKFIGKMYKYGRNQPIQNTFPLVDINQLWTDKKLYKHFNLTQQEINHIESTIK